MKESNLLKRVGIEMVNLISVYRVRQSDLKLLTLLGFIFSLFVLPIILANEYYRDDLTRILTGAYGWSSLGRPVANYVLQFGSGSTFSAVIDTAPFTQIICIVLLTMSAFYLHKHLLERFEINTPFIAVLPFLSPFLLTNISYRLDSMGMISGILLLTMALLSPKHSKWLNLYSVGLLFLSLGAYQPITNLFIALVGIELLFLFHRNNNITHVFVHLVNRMAEYIVAYSVYYFTIGLIATTKRKGMIPFDNQFPIQIWKNIEEFLRVSTQVYQTEFGLLCLTLVSIAGCIAVMNIFLKQRLVLFQWIIVLFIVSLLCMASLFGPMVLLERTLTDFRVIPSAYIIYPVLISLGFLAFKRLQWLALLPIIYAITISFQYGNGMNNQRDFERQIVTRIANEVHAKDLEKSLYTFGKVSYAPWTQNAVNNSPLVKALIDENIAENWILTGLLRQHGVENAIWLWSAQRRAQLPEMLSGLCRASSLIAKDKYFEMYEGLEGIYVIMTPDSNKQILCGKDLQGLESAQLSSLTGA